jgi:hypothetical protein
MLGGEGGRSGKVQQSRAQRLRRTSDEELKRRTSAGYFLGMLRTRCDRERGQRALCIH